MGLAKGHIKAGGREKGTANQTTKETREVLQMIISEELVKLPDYLAAITKPEVKAKLIIDLLPFVLPKMNTVDVNAAIDSGKNWTSHFDLSKISDVEKQTIIDIHEKCGTDCGQNQPILINWGEPVN